MALVLGRNVSRVESVRKFVRVGAVVDGAAKTVSRRVSSESRVKPGPLTKNENEILKSVYVSQSNNIFTNLAIEDWLYKNTDFNRHHILLIWRNSPSVVVGRHQNPWMESNIGFLAEKGVDIARRNSGGGTVYHDPGNLNLSFFTPRERYNRKYNLKVITQALEREWGLDVKISEKDDLLLDNYKVSGTASKLGRPNAYHHCTLLINANKSHLKESLRVNRSEFETNATQSVPSHVRNLTDKDSRVTFERLISAIGWEYLRTTPVSLQDGGKDLISKQRGFHLINPTDQWFPGLNKIRDEYTSWDWRFGKTPKFTVTRSFPVAAESAGKLADVTASVSLRVEKGRVTDVSFKLPEGRGESLTSFYDLVDGLRGKKYSSQTFDLIEKSLAVDENQKMVKTALRA